MSTVITVETLFGAPNTDILDVLNGEGEAAAAAALAAASANAKPMPAIHANNKVKPADPAVRECSQPARHNAVQNDVVRPVATSADGGRPGRAVELLHVADPIFEGASFLPITPAEMEGASITPRKIVDDFLYADVRNRIAAGGTGKTTLQIFEAVTIALARPLWGRKVGGPRRTTIVTREDSRETLVGRLREIIRAMRLTADEVQQVLEHVRIIDLSGLPFRLSCVIGDVVMPHQVNIDALVEKMLMQCSPDWLVFDPLVSFGVGESRVNDAEQGLIEAFRILRNSIGCCVEGVHHSGKANARDKVLDQYAGRGGSALADGSRMIAVMQPLDAVEWTQETGTRLAADETAIVMALPKLSYCPPQDPIFIRRRGFEFQQETVIKRTREQVSDAIAEQVLQFLIHERSQAKRYSQKGLEDVAGDMGLKRAEIRTGVARLKASGRLVSAGVNGSRDFHLNPVETLAATLAEDGPK